MTDRSAIVERAKGLRDKYIHYSRGETTINIHQLYLLAAEVIEMAEELRSQRKVEKSIVSSYKDRIQQLEAQLATARKLIEEVLLFHSEGIGDARVPTWHDDAELFLKEAAE